MALRFIAKDPNTGSDQSPTVWIDEGNGDLVLQGWKADQETTDECRQAGSIPEHEAVVRIPARMTAIVREACDAADRRTELR